MQVRVKVTPKAGRSEILGWEDDPRAGRLLRIRLQAPPVDGKANRALVEFLAAHLDIPKSRVRLLKGASSRIKTVEVPDDLTID
ncbi:MAG: DUF167 domain-containing protein [Akkermansiaceae bacterium]|nr:DUF167 domain-containing protein [Akkermansiaceae bacterium]NNM28020.1 DUF167 domain-containing protein [Akkermansiaceae bacterium]